METISKLKQLQDFQISWVVLVERESLCIGTESQHTLLEGVDREMLENQYRTKIMNILLAHENLYDEAVDIFSGTIRFVNRNR